MNAPVVDRLLLIAVTALSRFIFRSRFLYDVDSINFALGLRRFDPSVHQPHPPGYFLYVWLGRLLYPVFHDANATLVALSIVASCGTVAILHLLGCAWFDRAAARSAGWLFVVSPIAWFHGTVALTYAVEAFFSAAVGYLCWRVLSGEDRFVVPAAATLGIAAGFRPSSLVMLAPLLLFSIRRIDRKLAAGGFAVLVLTLAAWMIPMFLASSGSGAYGASLWALWRLVPARQTIFTSSVYTSITRVAVILGIYLLCFGCAALLPLAPFRKRNRIAAPLRGFTRTWVLPGLLIFTFVYLKFVNSGYLLVLMPPVCLWLGLWLGRWYCGAELRPAIKVALVSAGAALNVAVFLIAPLYFSWREVSRGGQELMAAISAVRQTAQPRQTLLVGFDSHFMGYRHAGYYLPEYTTVLFPEVPLASSTGVYVMQDQDTQLVHHFRVVPFQDFLLFPLPSSDREYREYMQHVRERFPQGVLKTTTRNGIELLTGPASALHVLFPNTIVLAPLPE